MLAIKCLRTVQLKRTKSIQIILAVLVVALSIAQLSLSARSVWYVKQAWRTHRTAVKILQHEDLTAGTSRVPTVADIRSWTNLVLYQPQPHGISMTDTYAMLLAGGIGTICGCVVLVMAVFDGDRAVNVSSLTGRKIRRLQLNGLPYLVVLDGILLLVSFIAVCLSWIQYYRSPDYWDRDGHLPWYHKPGLNVYETQDTWTFERWNCEMWIWMAYDAALPSRSEVRKLCRTAVVSRKLTAPLFLLAGVRLLSHFTGWRNRNIARREEATAQEHSDVSEKPADLQRDVYGVGISGEAGPSTLWELPAYRSRRIEADDTALRELPGDDGTAEVNGDNGAVELPGDAR